MNNENGKVLNIKSENITNVEIAVDDHFLLLRGDFENNVDGKIVLVKVKLTIPLCHIVYIQQQYEKSKMLNTVED
jgi:hypothetical protein